MLERQAGQFSKTQTLYEISRELAITELVNL